MRGNPRIALLLLGMAYSLSACASPYPRTYAAEAIEARIVDSETQQPLEGVVVVAHWPLLGGIEGNRAIAQMMVMETVTDQTGRFHFPAWGPLRRPMGYIRHEDPNLIIFKSGYRSLALSNQFEGSMDKVGESLRRSDWNGKTIEMKKFAGTMEEYKRHLYSFTGNLRFIEDDCLWKKTPMMILALQKQVDQFKAAGLVVGMYRVDYLPGDEKKCGSVKEYFRRYQQ